MDKYSVERLIAQFQNIPDELKELRIWALQNKKVPYTIKGTMAQSNNCASWDTYSNVIRAFKSGMYEGIGLFIEYPYFCLDLDKCVSNSEMSEQARKIVKMVMSYSERSISKSGIHIIAKGVKPGDVCKFNKIPGMKELEIYDRARFLVMSGNHIIGTPTAAEDRQQQLERIYCRACELQQKDRHERLINRNSHEGMPRLTDDEIVELLENAKNGEKFKRLFYGGDMSDYNNDWSRADAGLCGMIAFYTSDVSSIDRIFRKSSLNRGKWEKREKYRERTIEWAVTQVGDKYRGRNEKPRGA